MILLKGAPAARKITEELAERSGCFSRRPCIAFVRVGEDPDDLSYERAAQKRMEKAGASYIVRAFEKDVEEAVFLNELKKINDDPETDGVLVFRPLPKNISEAKAAAVMRPEKDLDCMSDLSLAAVFKGAEGFAPCTAEAVLALLKSYDVPLCGKRVVIVGRSLVIGKPAAMLFLQENATVTVCHSKTENLKEICREADVLVAAVGKQEMIDGSYIKEGAAVVDVGIHVKEDGSLCGDCNFESVSEKAAMLSPVPGGVGAVTTAVLADHLFRAYEALSGEKA